MYCTNCGRKIKDGERYCPYCGTKTFNEYEFNQQRVDYAISRRSIPMCIIRFRCFSFALLVRSG